MANRMTGLRLGDMVCAALYDAPNDGSLTGDAWAGRMIRALISDFLYGMTPDIPPEHRTTYAMLRRELSRCYKKQPLSMSQIKFADRGHGDEIPPPENAEEIHSAGPDMEHPDGDVACPADDDAIRMKAHNLSMTDREIAEWREYWTVHDWTQKGATKPMSRAACLASIGRWKLSGERMSAKDPSAEHPSSITPEERKARYGI